MGEDKSGSVTEKSEDPGQELLNTSNSHGTQTEPRTKESTFTGMLNHKKKKLRV